MKRGRCPKCGSRDVLANVEVRDVGRGGSHPLRVIAEEPEPATHRAVWIQGQSTGEVHAWICASCGYTEFYSDNLLQLLQSYRKGRA